MIKHIVMWKLKEEHNGLNKNELAQEMAKRLLLLKNKISEIVDIQVGINTLFGEKNYDLVLTSDFNTPDALAKYAVHEEHMKVVSFVKEIAIERAAVDYEY